MIELSIPLLLPSLNRMATGQHWSSWQKEKKTWAQWVQVAKHNQAKLGGFNPKYARVRIEVDRYCVSKITDDDNLRAGLKYLLDGLVVHGLLKDDNSEVIARCDINQIKIPRTPRQEPRTVVRIYPLA